MTFDDLGVFGRERRRPSAHEVDHDLDPEDDADRFVTLDDEREVDVDGDRSALPRFGPVGVVDLDDDDELYCVVLLDRKRHKAAHRVVNAANPAERERWESILADLDGAAALVRRADAAVTALVLGEVDR